MSNNSRFSGIRWKLALPGLGALFLLFMLMEAFWVPWQVTSTQTEIETEQQRILRYLSPALIEPMLSENLGQLYSTLDSVLLSNEAWQWLELRDLNDERLFPLGEKPELQDKEVVVSHTIEHNGKPHGTLMLHYDASAELAAKTHQIQLVAMVVFAVLLFTFLLNFLWQDFLIRRPARQLVDAARHLSEGNFDTGIHVRSQDEIGELAGELDGMRTNLRSLTSNLRDQAEHTQAIIDNMIDGLITIDAQGLIDAFNPAAEQIFGYDASEVLGENVRILMPSPHREKHDEYIRNYQSTGVARIIGIGREVEGLRKDGSLFPMELSISEVSREGRTMYVGMVRDITERTRVERMKSEFVSTVSHELRTPLTAISGSLGLITGGKLGELPAQVLSMVDIAHKNSLRLSHLINDLLDIEKLSAGKMHFDMQQHSVMPLIIQAIEANRGYGAERQVELRFIGKPVEADVRVDSQRLMQVLSNLISNAVKYSPEKGAVEVSAELHQKTIRVTVTDHGPGIPEEFHARIFQKFAQADSSDTRQKAGTGLGLAITRELVERMGGWIGFDSVEGQGASFYFELPQLKASDYEADIVPLVASAPVGPGILVVEDETDVAHLLGLMLTRAGYAVDIVNSGAEALEALQGNRYSAMTLDLMLPDISGLDIIRKVRGDPEMTDLPIVVVSAKMEDGRLEINGDAEGVEWLAKPFDEARLLAIVEQQMGLPAERQIRVLHVEDEPDLQQVIRTMAGEQFLFESASTLAEARTRIALQRFDVVILDLGLPDGSGWDLLSVVREQQPGTRVVILSGKDISVEEACSVEAALLKSQISAEQLLKVINNRINPKTRKSSDEHIITHSVRGG
jgi:PAS domain S-box-containing protein